ncbi:hypothetical protein INR49_030327, partial [Caranx melampygus]
MGKVSLQVLTPGEGSHLRGVTGAALGVSQKVKELAQSHRLQNNASILLSVATNCGCTLRQDQGVAGHTPGQIRAPSCSTLTSGDDFSATPEGADITRATAKIWAVVQDPPPPHDPVQDQVSHQRALFFLDQIRTLSHTRRRRHRQSHFQQIRLYRTVT